jgi:hypothetical protein
LVCVEVQIVFLRQHEVTSRQSFKSSGVGGEAPSSSQSNHGWHLPSTFAHLLSHASRRQHHHPLRALSASSPMATSMSSSARFTSPSSDSENYDANHSNFQDSSDPEPESSNSSSPLILYSPPTFWSIIRGAAINLLLPFVNGLMLGFGELVAHEWAWRLGWGGTKVSQDGLLISRNSRSGVDVHISSLWRWWKGLRRMHLLVLRELDDAGANTDKTNVGFPITSKSSRCEACRTWGGDDGRRDRAETKEWRGNGPIYGAGMIFTARIKHMSGESGVHEKNCTIGTRFN